MDWPPLPRGSRRHRETLRRTWAQTLPEISASTRRCPPGLRCSTPRQSLRRPLPYRRRQGYRRASPHSLLREMRCAPCWYCKATSNECFLSSTRSTVAPPTLLAVLPTCSESFGSTLSGLDRTFH